MTIRKQLFAAAGIAIVACIGLGVYAAASVMRLNELVRQTYDNALMASTFAQSAQTDFVRLDRALRDALAARDLAEFERQEKLAETSSTTLLEDLGVVRDRTLSDKGRVLVAEITSHLEAWEPKRKASLVRARGAPVGRHSHRRPHGRAGRRVGAPRRRGQADCAHR